MKIKLNFKDKTSINPSKPTKRILANFIRGRVDRNVTFEGSGYVEYRPGYRNEFHFTSKKDLEDKLWPCLEKELVDAFSVAQER